MNRVAYNRKELLTSMVCYQMHYNVVQRSKVVIDRAERQIQIFSRRSLLGPLHLL